jgi:TnpA family transposase
VAKTLHLLDYCTDAAFRRRIQGQLNRTEARRPPARAVFHGRRGELHQPYHNGQEDQIGALRLVVNCIALCNTIYVEGTLEHLRVRGHPVLDEDAERLSPLGRDHINLVGRYRLTLAERVRRGGYRELNSLGQIAA